MFRFGTALFFVLMLASGVASGQSNQAKLVKVLKAKKLRQPAYVVQSSEGQARTASPSSQMSSTESQNESSKKTSDSCEKSTFLTQGMCKAWNYVFLPR